MSQINPNENPFQSPGASLALPAFVSGDWQAADVLRRHYGPHEASVRVTAVLFALGAVACMGLMFVGMVGSTSARGDMSGFWAIVIVAALVSGVLNLVAFFGLRHRSRVARWVASLFAVSWLFSFPLGTILGVYLLYLYWSQAGRFVFSDTYYEIVALTPTIEPRAPAGAWIVLAGAGALVALVVLAFAICAVAA